MFASIENASALLIAVLYVVVACLVVFVWRRARPLNKKIEGIALGNSAAEPPRSSPVEEGTPAPPTTPAALSNRTEDETPTVEVAGEAATANGDRPSLATVTAGPTNFPSTGSAGQDGPTIEVLSAIIPEPDGADSEIAVMNPGTVIEEEENTITETEDRSGLEIPPGAQEEWEVQGATEAPGEPLEDDQAGELAVGSVAPHEPVAGEPASESGEDSFEPTEEDDGVPARYRAPRAGPGKARKKKAAESCAGDAGREQALELRVRCIVGRHAFCRFHLLAERRAGEPAEVEGRNGRRAARLTEAGEDWYEVEESEDLPALLEHGTTIKVNEGKEAGEKWKLRGRDLYILAPLHGILGFVSTTRLAVGLKQIVLCRENYASAVEAILVDAGCAGIGACGRDRGAPAGWVFFGPATPSRSVPQVAGDDLLNLVRPLPDIEILLEGGLWLKGSSWMAGYPPRIHMAGEMPPGVNVTIDGEVAEATEESIYHTPNSGSPGTHVVWCAGKTASYSISEPEEGWEQWDAYQHPRGSICGARTTRGDGNGAPETLISVPTTNPILIGAVPGEIFRCDARPGRQWSGFVPFSACWALPADPLQCDRSVRRALLLRPVSPAQGRLGMPSKNSARRNILQWCYAIRDCQRKRLLVYPDDAASQQLWREYTAAARAIWRAARKEL